ncbi:MAG: 6-carboxytetrahydropterin synthase [Phycisphaerales bacterium]|nr:6-carboxytetrahydropterin synthase [Phycisphaerales bacterium]
MFEVTVSGWFAAAHQLRLSDGSLEPLHGHNWRVEVTCAGESLDAMGVLVDFTKLKPALDSLLARMHDRHLNELPAFAARNPSAENVALHIAESLGAALPTGARVACVEVEEAPGCVARYRPDQT